MAKSPTKSDINLLQELSVKQGYVPIYNFIEKRIGAVSMEFMCYVSCKELKTHGIGSTKKEAKHNAAKNMLSLLATNDSNISLPVDTSPSPANILSSPAKVYETSPLHKQPSINCNYIGLLNEFCQQRKISTTEIIYKHIYDEESSRFGAFTMEVKVGSLCERGTGQCKKSAKQEAAKKLFQRMNPHRINSDYTNEIDSLEKNIQELGTGILKCNKEASQVVQLSEKAKLLYRECTDKRYGSNQDMDPDIIQNWHHLFKKNYSNKIPYNMRKKMQIIKDTYTDKTDLLTWHEIRQDIESSLEVTIQQITIRSTHNAQNHIICLRMSSKPCITQFGIGATKVIAESRATYNLVVAILEFLE